MDYLILWQFDTPDFIPVSACPFACGMNANCGCTYGDTCLTFTPCGTNCSQLCSTDCGCYSTIGDTPVWLNSVN